MDRSKFYKSIRASGLFPGGMTQSQVDGMERLLDTWAKYYPADPIEYLAYNLATSYHETDATMQPITERGQRSYFDKYEPGTRIGAMLGNTQKGDGYKYRGQGDAQNTGRRNAKKATDELNARFHLGVDLVNDPGKRGDPFISAHSLFLGNREGWWTGKKLSDYIRKGSPPDWFNGRAIVNGDKNTIAEGSKISNGRKLANYADAFLDALKAAGPFPLVEEPVISQPEYTKEDQSAPVVPVPTPPDTNSLVAAVMAFFQSLFARKA